MSWHLNRMAVLDLETTDKDPRMARVVTATVAFVSGGRTSDFFSVLVNPGVEIPQEAIDVHGITTEMAVRDGVSPAVAIPGVLEALRTAVRAGYALVVFNARYDLTVLDREARRLGLEPLSQLLMRVIDPVVIDRHIDKYRGGKRRLVEMCETLGVRLERAHDAAFDALAAGRVAWVIGERGRIVRRRPRNPREREEVVALHREWDAVHRDLSALHMAQKRWAYTQAVELEEYFHRGYPSKGVPPQPWRRVERAWPVIPVWSLPVAVEAVQHAAGVNQSLVRQEKEDAWQQSPTTEQLSMMNSLA